MKQYLIFGVFFTIFKKKKTTAKEIAERFEVSPRTIYRYVDALSSAGIPIMTQNGKGGGISLPDDFRLETFCLSEREKSLIKDSLCKCQNSDNQENISHLISYI